MNSPQHADPIEHGDDASRRHSKSASKRHSNMLRDLGSELIQLNEGQLEQMNLPEELARAVKQARSMKRDGAYKRQTKFIGKLLRNLDTSSIEEKLEDLAQTSAAANRALHHLEAWRDRLIAEGDVALDALMADYPQLERPRLRRLIDSARVERERSQPPKSSRLIFKYLRELFEADQQQPA